MTITGLRFDHMSRVIYQDFDRFESVAMVQAKIRHKSKNGQDVEHYVYQYYDGDTYRKLPRFFMTNEDDFEKIKEAHPHAGKVLEIGRKYIRKTWDRIEDAKNTEYEAILQFLSNIDINSSTDAYHANITITYNQNHKYLIPWKEVVPVSDMDFDLEISKDFYMGTPYTSAEKLSGIKVSNEFVDKIYPLNELDGIYLMHGITEIKDGMFDHSSLREIVLAMTVHRIGSYAFSGCRMLEHLYLPIGATVNFNAFRGSGDFGPALQIHYICGG